jgi:hypothetical protein
VQRWQPQLIRSTEALYLAIERGLEYAGDRDPGAVAEETLLELATTRGIDSAETDLLGQAEHLGSIANMVTWLLRTGAPWRRPEPIQIGNTVWTPSAFLSATESHLRRVVLCGRWDAYRLTEEEHNWFSLEAAVYGVPMDLIVVVLGQERNGRRTGPLCRGWQHPVSKSLRFRKRDGAGFDGAWTPVLRERSNFTREEWLEALVGDGLLPEVVLIHTVQPERIGAILHLAESKLSRITSAVEPPEPQLSQCFDRLRPCPFRVCCPRSEEPSEALGFVATSFRESPDAGHSRPR